MNQIKLFFVCGYLMLLFGCSLQPNPANLRSGKVTRVVSGQTIEVLLTGTSEVTLVRITGIEAPDLRQSPWGEAAKKKLVELVIGLPIEIEQEDAQRDRFNRLNAHIWQNQSLISQQLVQSGCVLANDRYDHSYSKLLMESQEYARLMGYGIWNPNLAMRYTPSQFRSMNK
ncbi:MAG: thermonuclease family protein [Pleurocapsa sp.]